MKKIIGIKGTRYSTTFLLDNGRSITGTGEALVGGVMLLIKSSFKYDDGEPLVGEELESFIQAILQTGKIEIYNK